MNTSGRNHTAKEVVRVNRYDVLLLRSSNNQSLRFSPGVHVGNSRFTVLLSMFRQRYMQAHMLGDEDECRDIAHEVLDTVSNKCYPNGRFFVQSYNNKWRRIKNDDQCLIVLIQSILRTQPRQSSKATAEGSPERVSQGSAGFDLLCKAASKTLAPEKLVTSPATFDVVCDADELFRGSRHTGNNRLSIILNMRASKYSTSDQEEKKRVAEEVVSSIVDDANARFLRSDQHSGMYNVLSRETATVCIEKALEAASEAGKQRFREAEVEKLRVRRHKKAVLKQLEHQRGGKTLCDAISASKPPTTFAALTNKPNYFASKAA